MRVAIWWRIPKTGSTALQNRLAANGLRDLAAREFELIELPRALVIACGHAKPAQMVAEQRIKENTIRQAFGFCIVRNPWARMVSLWFGMGDQHRPTRTFDEFILRGYEDRRISGGDERVPIGSTMDEWLLYRGKSCCNLVIRLERIHEMFPALAGALGVDPSPLDVQNDHPHPPYPEMYTDETREAVAYHERYCIDRFGYRFGEDTKAEFLPAAAAIDTPGGPTHT